MYKPRQYNGDKKTPSAEEFKKAILNGISLVDFSAP